MRKLLLLFCSLLLTFHSWGQHPYFREIAIESGNDELKVNTLFQEKEGLIYIGTNQGLYRYDGFSFEKLNLPDTLKNEKISLITGFENDGVFVGLESGLLFLWKDERFFLITAALKSPIRSVLEIEKGRLWVATYGEGIFYKTGRDWHRLAGIPDPYVYQLMMHPSGKILAATDAGLVLIDPDSDPLRFRVFDSKNGLPDNIVKVMGLLPDNNVLLGFQEKGISIFDMKTNNFKDILEDVQWPFGSVNCLTKLQDEFWIGTDGKGIVDYEFSGDKRIRNFFDKTGFPFKNVNAVLKDMEGNIWIAADNKLIISPGEQIELVSSTDEMNLDSLQAITSSQNGGVWFSTPKGLYNFEYMALGKRKLKKFPISTMKDLHIVSLYEDESGLLWIGTFNNGLLILNPYTGVVTRFGEKNGLGNANVISINGKGNKIWLATLGGIVQCIVHDFSSFKKKPEYEFKMLTLEDKRFNDFVYTVYIDSKERVWFGTDGNGVLMYDGIKLNAFSELNAARVVYSITEDSKKNIWFSTPNQGVIRYDGNQFNVFNLSKGLSSLDIMGLSRDNTGNLVVVNKKGLDIINISNFNVKTYGEESGIGIIDADLNTVTRDSKGGVWIGTRSSLIRFKNYSRGKTEYPKVILKKVYTFMKQVVDLKDTIFDYNQNNISIEYTGIWFTQPELISYRYRLKGFSTDWITTRDRIVTFPNLPPGHYSFEVVAGLNGKASSREIASYSFRIEKPLWKENWVVFTFIVLLTGGILLYIRDRDIRLRRIEGLKKEKVEYQFATLKSQVNPHFLFNSFNTLIAIIEEDKERAISYVEKLSDYFRNMIQYRDKDIISLEEELAMVETYYFLQQKRFGEHLELRVEIPEDWKKSFGLPPLSLQLLIENAVKHNAVSHETPLLISVHTSEGSTLVVENNLNPKLSAEPSTGIGLDNIINRFIILSGNKVKVNKANGKFVVEVPLIKMKVKKE